MFLRNLRRASALPRLQTRRLYFSTSPKTTLSPRRPVSAFTSEMYYYDQNRDILPLNEDGIEVDHTGNVTFSVSPGVTYLLNSRLLNAATIFENPTANHPFTLGIVVLVSVFAVWVVFFLITKKGAQKQPAKKEKE